ncbi:DUF2075 domain-containing protein [Apilactobacillus xinyiensis]|uniref:DUF2075 domain-containing protein n=1 Tax=Apilactobacillus xinyiensis TaxID=2841032 RepID=A0ABT0I0Z6_9LACO|nr:DUF2075 domain-containing protein [Apilactobacillus xinyiensis]MCK8624498.1 DUF2075 domain-containing protein [Apilactobacillus xinyiensis]MCL0330429.1 DUF2075 domain-containing protein [Apilactobacillus xinyiensis]
MQLQNAAVDKLNPNKNLTDEQQYLVEKIENFAKENLNQTKHAVFTIYGDAGTGKSVVLSKLFYDFQQMAKQSGILKGTQNHFLVNHPEILKVYKNIAGDEPNVLKKNFNRPTSFINSMNKNGLHSDITIVDEAHLLLSRSDHYNNFYQDNQLTEIIKKSKVTIIVFDHRQVLRTKMFWNEEMLRRLLEPYHNDEYHLTKQFRMTASQKLVDWINSFTDGYLAKIPNDAKQNYDFKVFEDAEEMRKTIVKKNKQVGLSRIVSTSGYPSTLDGGKHYVIEGNFKMPWDQYNFTQTPWAEIPETINEVGSIFTCQGFDLNYVGVILGPPISLSNDGQTIDVNLNKFTDVESLKKRPDMKNDESFEKIKKQLILNSINVLMKRGVHGLYIFAHDKNLRDKLLSLFKNIK